MKEIALLPSPRESDWMPALREGLVSGSLASLLATAVLAFAGQRETGSAVAPINAVSHWLWGEEALLENEPTWRHTALGLLTNHAAAVFWAVLHAKLARRSPWAGTLPGAVLGGLATSAAASAIDYTIVPKRLTPGFEHRLSTRSMVGVFAALAAGVAIGSMLMRDRD
ncbi:hypothetical protein EZ313_11190 [Ramlibacter henchirensis]|uniref:DUF1440 domain-containing protein n=1 Tax=Ramlibacter henchirensis TaxID=204072 RepID=A0A4Z0C5V0_9BURK|nr:hypothetical protein [Ramlibacter henchirensis]TFZ07147.1 hypothetical protein EZ313_11190 [Ramlibacter henchirensis]